MLRPSEAEENQRVLILAPFGRDGELIQRELQVAGFSTTVCSSIEELCGCMEKGAGAALVGDEALVPSAIRCLATQLATQAPWSDFPLLVMTSGGGSNRASRYRLGLLEPLGNVTLLERPLRPVTLISSLRAALRARRHQYEIRDHLEQLKSSEEALRLSEARLRFLSELDDATRPLTDPQEITQTAARFLGEHLQVNRCAYADVEEDQDTFNLTGDYNREVPSIVGRYTFTQFGAECLRLMRAGKAYVVQDSETDPRVVDVIPSYRLTKIRSVICVPLLKSGRFVAAMAVHQITPREWKQEEVELLLSVANRCWESIERVHITRDLQEREQRYRFLAESIPQMVWTATSEGNLDYVNEQVARYFGCEPETVLGAGWLRWVHPEDQERTVERWKQSLATRTPYETLFRLWRESDGSWRWHLVRALPLIEEGGKVAQWFGTCTDMQDQRKTEEELRRMNRELEEFAYVASHDLQEPLRMVNIYTQKILNRLQTEEADLHDYAGFVRGGVTRMGALIDDLLKFSRTVHTEELPVGTADLSFSLQEALLVLRDQIEESGAVITCQLLPLVRGDTQQIAHVFQNLLSNAMKYRKQEVRPQILISAALDGNQWTVSVRDTGIGFEPQYAQQIFGLFKRLHKDEYPGTGLGLAICQRIVERYGGRMWAEGRAGEGATFSFSLPRVETENKASSHK